MIFLQELIDLVIDELWWDKASLINVSMVSRAWLPRSRKHLFQTLRLLPLSRYGDLRFPTHRPISEVQRFIDLCSHPHSTIPDAGPTHVTLTADVVYADLEHTPEDVRYRYSTEPERRRNMAEKRIAAFITLLLWLRATPRREQGMTVSTYAEKLFRNVKHLTLSPVGSSLSMRELKKLLSLPFPPFPGVTHLVIDGQPLHPRKFFLFVLSSFESLERLSVTHASDNKAPMIEAPIEQVSFPPSLTHIEIRVLHTSFQTLKFCSTLENLIVHIRYPTVEAQFTAINCFLESSVAVKDKRLKHCKLVLRSQSHSRPVVIDSLSKFIHFNRIQSWTIDADCKAFLYGGIETIPNVTTIVPQHLQTIPDQLTAVFDHTLSQLFLFPGLRSIETSIIHPCDRKMLQRSGWDEVEGTVPEGSEAHRNVNKMEKRIRSQFPKCDSKGLLKLHFIYRPNAW
ncbi:hypothetical protein Moror_15631 [Moniliophthora roreri MCA 2997]|uniref:F-box domain-containing protein n=2 Tax=Moniliophthora roreri TaxID=221103 RepID=V2WP80_MONRO|nr:hypothetical protein Moror_15631 [Moniliophthora roreri MCA 2997]